MGAVPGSARTRRWGHRSQRHCQYSWYRCPQRSDAVVKVGPDTGTLVCCPFISMSTTSLHRTVSVPKVKPVTARSNGSPFVRVMTWVAKYGAPRRWARPRISAGGRVVRDAGPTSRATGASCRRSSATLGVPAAPWVGHSTRAVGVAELRARIWACTPLTVTVPFAVPTR